MADCEDESRAACEEAASAIGDLVRAGDLVLVKGSRGVRTDLVVDRVKAHGARQAHGTERG